MDKRPKIEIKLTNTDKAIELIGFLILIAFWGIIIVSYNNLPEQIPIHYNGFGEAQFAQVKGIEFKKPKI